LDSHFIKKRAFKELKTIALAGFMLVSLPFFLLLCILAVGFAVQIYSDARDRYFCEDSRLLQSDEAAIALVQNSQDVQFFLKKYPDVSLSKDYISKNRNKHIEYDKSSGYWVVHRDDNHNEVIWVDFLYHLGNPSQGSLNITCSMRECNPLADCIMDGPRD
jgi:hypothetical protein